MNGKWVVFKEAGRSRHGLTSASENYFQTNMTTVPFKVLFCTILQSKSITIRLLVD